LGRSFECRMISEGLETFGLQMITCEIAGAIPMAARCTFYATEHACGKILPGSSTSAQAAGPFRRSKCGAQC
jgi:hypothetical protein